MSSRRSFLKQTAVLAAGVAGVSPSTVAPAAESPSSAVLQESVPGSTPADRVPDTLELGEHGRLALGGTCGDKAPMKPSPEYVHPANLVRWTVS